MDLRPATSSRCDRGLQAFAGVGYYDLSDLFGDGYWYGSLGVSLTRQTLAI